jgi:hypothetical protein
VAPSSDDASPEASSPDDTVAAGQTEAAMARALSPLHRSQTVARRKTDAVDLIMRFYDPVS